MGKKKTKKEVFRSMKEFEERFFPKSLRQKLSEKDSAPDALGNLWDEKSLEIIRKALQGR